MKKYNFTRFIALALTAIMLCLALTACSCDFGDRDRDRDRDDDETPAASSSESSSKNEDIVAPPPDEALPSVRYGIEGHFPINVTRNEYNENGQLVSVTPLDIYNLMPDYENVQYTMARRYEYDSDGKPETMILNNRDMVRFTYDADGYTASGYANKDQQVKITVNNNGIIVKEEYIAQGEPWICFEYDKNGNLVKDTRPHNGYEMTLQYETDSLVFTMKQDGDLKMTITVNMDDSGNILFLTEEAEGDNVTINYTYDSKGRVSKSVAGDTTYQTVYDDYHRTVLSKGTIEYDSYKKTIDKKYEYDENGNIVKFYLDSTDHIPNFDREVRIYTYTRNGDGFEKTSVVYNKYDKKGNVVSTRNEEY